jgi:D-arabinose 1-dehydrogenase-like Zn-dependent alcohol dehydrogenase
MLSAEAAPFMCAGQTVFTPMIRYGIKAGDRVGIIGIGGLGHLAIGFASKLGAEVAVFSSTENKRKEALSLGATEFFVTSELKTKKPEKKLDFLIITANTHPDWLTFIDLMAPQSHIILNQLTPDDMVIPFLPFILKEISINSQLTATPEEVETMLHFAADHGVKPLIEEFPMTEEGVALAIEKLMTGKIRYRGVLTAPA